MKVSQISVFLENKSGRLAEVTQVLAEQGINIRALCIAETMDYGVLRLIANDPARAKRALSDGGFTVTEADVLAVEVEDRPGGLARVIRLLAQAGVNVEYVYAFVTRQEKALVVLRVEQMDKAAQVLTGAGVRLVSGDEIYAM
jgi:hypothetical protein